MAKTYVPTLSLIARSLNVYIVKYQATIEANLTAPQKTALQALLTCLQAFLTALGELPVNP
jgi:hypothetical protein